MSTTKEQAVEYVARVGINEARKSNHYGVGSRHCKCGTCFCCEVVNAVEDASASTHKEFIVLSVSANTNSFGLSGVILLARDGEAFEAACCRYTPGQDLFKGDVLALPIADPDATGTARYSWQGIRASKGSHVTFEIPKALPPAPANVLAEIFPAK